MKKEIILIDDEEIYHELWLTLSRDKNINITCFFHPNDALNYIRLLKPESINAIVFDYYFSQQELVDIFNIREFCSKYSQYQHKIFLYTSVIGKTEIDHYFKEKIVKQEENIMNFYQLFVSKYYQPMWRQFQLKNWIHLFSNNLGVILDRITLRSFFYALHYMMGINLIISIIGIILSLNLFKSENKIINNI